jgi:hypothetical protein
MPFLQEGLGYDLGKDFRLGVQGAEGDTDVPILPKLSGLQRLEEMTMPNQPAVGPSQHDAMKAARTSAMGWFLSVSGLLVVIFSYKIVFPGLEALLGIESIVGRQNVYYQPDGRYYFTNPGAMARWICSVAGIGIILCSLGVWLLIRARRAQHGSPDKEPESQRG